MKFRAKLVEALTMKNLALIAWTISKLTRHCILRLNKNNFTLLVCEENSSPKQVLLWCVLEANLFFSEFNIEGLTQANEIFLELPPDMLFTSLSTLKSGNSNARCVKIKLTDKMTPCLTVEIELSTEYGLTRSCIHDIPVKVIPVLDWGDYSDPPRYDYNASVDLIQLKKMRGVVEKCKKLGSFVTISTNSEDFLCITTSSQTATVKTILKNSKIFTKKDDEGEQSVRVDVKKLCQLMCCEQLSPKRTLLHFLENKLLFFHLTCDHYALHFYLLAVEE